MKYKLLIFDIDGTAMQTSRDALPSPEVIQAIKQAQRVVSVSAATGRGLVSVKKALEIMNLKDPCILSGGTQIIDPISKEILWEIQLSEEQVEKVIEVCIPFPYELWFINKLKGFPANKTIAKGFENIVYIMACDKKDTEKILRDLSLLKDVVAYPIGSWTNGRIDIHVTHRLATKKQAVKKLIEILDVKKKEVLAVGDSSNDVPLFESVGFKVAMGNATDDLKKKADYIAPSVNENGLAYVINKFILS